MEVQCLNNFPTEFLQERHDPLNVLPIELAYKILSNLDPTSLGRSCLVDKRWNAIANDDYLWRSMRQDNYIGAKQWSELLGADVGMEPPIPREIYKLMKDSCLFSNDGNIKVEDSQMLILIPETINDEPLNLQTFAKLIDKNFPDHQIVTDCVWPSITGNSSKSHWILITKDLLNKSTMRSYDEQKELVAKKGEGKYQVPNALYVAIAVYMEYARSGRQTFLLGTEPLTATRCQESLFEGEQVVVGGFGVEGLIISNLSGDNKYIGVAAQRDFLFKP